MLPFKCVLCFSKETVNAVCPPCLADLRRLRIINSCRRCALPHAAPICGGCLSQPPAFDAITAPFIYAPPLDALVKHFKYGDGWQLAKLMAQLLPPPPAADMVLPVPLHWRRERERGFNQARELAKRAHLRHHDGVLWRIVETMPQASLPDRRARHNNVKGVFRVDGDVRGLSLLLVDDVMTSGATINEAAKVLKAAGANTVSALVFARAIK